MAHRQLIPRTSGERFYLPVDVGNDSARIGGHQGVDVSFEEGAGIELLIAQALTELFLLCLDLLERGIVCADQQVTDNFTCASRKAVTDTTAGNRLPSFRI